MNDLTDTVRRLVGYAARAAAPEAFLAAASTQLVGALLELTELRRHLNPRRAATLADVHRLAVFFDSCKRNAVPTREAIRAARAKFGWRRSAFYRRLRLSRDSRNNLAIAFVRSAPPGVE